MRYSPPAIVCNGTLELERRGLYPRTRVRCSRGHYVLTNGDTAPASTVPPPMLLEHATRAIVLHRRSCA